MFNRNAAFQLAACLLICFIAYAFQVRYQPYMSPGGFEATIAEHVAASYSSPIHARLRSTLAGIEIRGRKRVYRNVMDARGRFDTKAALGLLGSYAFDYNTVEQCVWHRVGKGAVSLTCTPLPP